MVAPAALMQALDVSYDGYHIIPEAALTSQQP
jgi:hypothetical protein